MKTDLAINAPRNELTPLPAFDTHQLGLMKRTVARTLNDDEFNVFIEIAKSLCLNPLQRQIYAIVTSPNNADKRSVAYITGIDGMRSVASRHRDYRPDDQAFVLETDETEVSPANPKGIVRAVVKCFKQDPQTRLWDAVVGVAYWDEFAPIKDMKWDDGARKMVPCDPVLDTRGQWGKMPRLMLAKCAEAQALRKGWPEGLSAVYSEEEFPGVTVEGTATEVLAAGERADRERKLGGGNKLPIQWRQNGPIVFVPMGEVFDAVQKWIAGEGDGGEPDKDTVSWFRSINTHALKQFWANDPGAALEVRRQLDAIMDADDPAPIIDADQNEGQHNHGEENHVE
jgi:phage recombination protein Bet